MMSDDQIIAVVTAHKEGKQIQQNCIADNDDYWLNSYNPVWDFRSYNYRVAEPLLQEIWLQHESGNMWKEIGWGIGIHFRVIPNTPEPRKPREWWAVVDTDGTILGAANRITPGVHETIRVREVIE